MKTNIRLITQQNKWYCGPASVKMVLDGYGVVESQEEIGRVLGATKDGCDLVENIERFNHWNLFAGYLRNCSLKQAQSYLRQGVHPILYWNRRHHGHWSVFADITDLRVRIADPGNSHRITSFTKPRFQKRWRDPENPEDRREMIVILPPGYKTINQLFGQSSQL